MKQTIRWKNRFAVRMIAAFVAVILVSALFTSISFYLVASRIVKDNVRESSVQIAQQSADSLSFILGAGSDMSDRIYSDARIQAILSSKESASDVREWRENEDYLESVLNNLIYSSSFVSIVYVLQDTSHSWGSGTFSRLKLASYGLESQEWVREANTQDGGLVWLPLQRDRLSNAGDNTELVLPIGRVMKDFDSMENTGYVLINLNGRRIIDQITRLKLGVTGGFVVTDETGRVMIDSDLNRIGQPAGDAALLRHIAGSEAVEFEYEQGGVPYYGVKQRLVNGWLLVGTVPVQEITGKLNSLHYTILTSFLIVVLAGMLIGFFFAKRVTRPIKQLTDQMRLAQQGDLGVRTDIHGSDEIGLMSRQFNRMIADITRLMEQVTDEQRQKQEAEMRALHHRINPHFLFNTLSTLRWLLKDGQTAKADQGLSAMIRLLEANMGKKGNFITLGEEFDILEKYLAILELRYSRPLRLTIDAEPDATAHVIPRMLVQPLVENAVFHGIVPKEGDGLIRVTAVSDEGGRVVVTVEDNGVGMLPERAAALQSVDEAAAEGIIGIGLKHVQESARLHFGPGSGVKLSSVPGEGTTAVLTLTPKAQTKGGWSDAPLDDRR